jgi:HEAT repeat protein
MKIKPALPFFFLILLCVGAPLLYVASLNSLGNFQAHSAPENENRSDKVNRLVKLVKSWNGFAAISATSQLSMEFISIQDSPELKKLAESTIPQLTPLLRDFDADVRQYAVRIVGSMRESAQPAIPQIIPLLKDSDYSVRSAAAEALGKIGKPAESAIPQMIPLLKDSSWVVRRDTASSLGNMGDAAKPAIPELILLLDEKNSENKKYVRHAAILALGSLGGSERVIAPFVKDSDKSISDAAVLALSLSFPKSHGKVKSQLTTPELLSMFNDSNKELRDVAVRALSANGELSKLPVSRLDALVQEFPCDDLCISAVDALGDIGRPAKATVPKMISLLKSQTPNDTLVKSIVRALGKMHEEKVSQSKVPTLGAAETQRRKMLGTNVQYAKELDESAIPFLNDSDESIRYTAARFLVGRNWSTELTIPQLVPLLKDSSSYIQDRARSALTQKGYKF